MRNTQIYILLLVFLTISCRNVEQNKPNTETLKNSAIIEQKTTPITTIETAKQISKSDILETVSEQQVVKENTNKLKIKFTKIDSIDYFEFQQKYSNGIIIATILHWLILKIKNVMQILNNPLILFIQ